VRYRLTQGKGQLMQVQLAPEQYGQHVNRRAWDIVTKRQQLLQTLLVMLL
jgi:hypothetical protein